MLGGVRSSERDGVVVRILPSPTRSPETDWPTATDTADSSSIVVVVKVSVCVLVMAAVVAADRVKAVPLIAWKYDAEVTGFVRLGVKLH